MSHNQDLSAFDLIVVLLLVVGLGALAHLSSVPEKASTPGASWPEPPSVQIRVESKETLPAVENTVESLDSDGNDLDGITPGGVVESEEESWE